MMSVIARAAALRTIVLRSLAATCLVAAALVAMWPAPAQAESPDATGWWNKLKPELPPDAGNPIPPPPGVPPEGLMVANDPTGPQAIAALRFEATRARKAVLTLHAADEEQPIPPTSEIAACPVLGNWDQAFDAPWNRRPEVDCLTLSPVGEISDDGLTVTWQINEEYFRLGVLVNRIEIAVLPHPESRVPFRAVFERPGFDALVADGPLIEPAGSTEGEAPSLAAPELPSASDSPPLDGGSGALPGGDVAGPTGEATPPAGGDALADPGRSGETTPIESAAPLTAPGSASDRLMAAALLVLTAAGLFLASGRQARQPRLIGGLAHRSGEATGPDPDGAASGPDEGTPGGIGRFRRVRTREPVG